MKLSETIRKIDCSGNLSLKVSMFEIADAVDDMEKGFLKIKAERDALKAELAALRKQEPFGYFRCNSFGWEDCHDDDEGAIALYEWPEDRGEFPQKGIGK